MSKSVKYIKLDSFMTKAEETLYRLMLDTFNKNLKCIHKSVLIFAKPRLADLIEVNPTMDKESRDKAFYSIAYKHIDYAVLDKETLEILFTVELDDNTHNSESRIYRDEFVDSALKECSITLFRVTKSIKFVSASDLSEMTDYLMSQYKPICNICGEQMHFKKSTRNFNYGHRFYGCSARESYNKGCQNSIDIE